MDARIYAQYFSHQIAAVMAAAVEVLGNSTPEYEEYQFTTEELFNRLPDYCTGGGYIFSYSWLDLKTDVPMPVQFTKGMDWKAFSSHQEEYRASVLRALEALPVGGNFGYGWSSNESVDYEVTKIGPDRWVERVTTDTQAERWEADRAAMRLPFRGCRQAIWDKARLEGPVNHELLDMAINAAMI